MAPAATIITTMVPVDFSDGNATVWVEFDPVTTDINGNPLVIDHYNLYYDDNPYMDSPGMVPTTSTAMYLYYGNVGMTQAGFLRVTAVDEDGVLVADSQPGRPLPDAAAIQVNPMDILMVPAAGAGASK